jgi:hypothetical protein
MVPSHQMAANGQPQQTIALNKVAIAELAAVGSGPSVQLLAMDVTRTSQPAPVAVGGGGHLAPAVRIPATAPVVVHAGAIPPGVPGAAPPVPAAAPAAAPTSAGTAGGMPAVLPKPLQPVMLQAGLQVTMAPGMQALRPTPLPVPPVVAVKPDPDRKPLLATHATLQQVHQQYMVSCAGAKGWIARAAVLLTPMAAAGWLWAVHVPAGTAVPAPWLRRVAFGAGGYDTSPMCWRQLARDWC